jgi:hypothetical protein
VRHNGSFIFIFSLFPITLRAAAGSLVVGLVLQQRRPLCLIVLLVQTAVDTTTTTTTTTMMMIGHDDFTWFFFVGNLIVFPKTIPNAAASARLSYVRVSRDWIHSQNLEGPKDGRPHQDNNQ